MIAKSLGRLPLLMALAAAAPAAAQSPKTLAAISSAPLTIEADLFEIRRKDNKAVFSGNVRVSQGVLRMRAAKLVIFYRDKEKAAAERSQPAEKNLDIVSMRASGGVRLFTPPSRSARGRRALYHVASRQIRMEGGVLLKEGGNVLRGEGLTIDLIAGTSLLHGGSGEKRAHGLFRASSP